MVQQWERLYYKKADGNGARGAWKGAPGDELARPPLWRGIIKTWKSQYDTATNRARMNGTTPIPEERFCWDFFIYSRVFAKVRF